MPGSGWEHLSEEEKRENRDYTNELRFGGDPRSDEEIKEDIYAMDDDELEEYFDGRD